MAYLSIEGAYNYGWLNNLQTVIEDHQMGSVSNLILKF